MSQPQTSRIRWLLVTWLFVLSAISFLDRTNISIAGNSLAAEYHLNTIQLGWVFSAFLWGYALFQTPAGWLADHFGSRRVLAIGVFWWGIFTALTAAVPSTITRAIIVFISIRFLLGVGEAVIYPASNQFVSCWIPVKERGIANGLIFAGVGAGAGFAPPLITYLMTHHGWRSSFWICALIGCVAGLVWYVAARDTPAQHLAVSASELETIRAGLIAPSSNEIADSNPSTPRNAGQQNTNASRKNDGRKTAVPWAAILSEKSVWAVTFSYFCFGYVAWIFFSWFYTYLAKVRGLNLKSSAFYAMLPFIAMSICCPLGGLLNDWLTRHVSKRLGRCGVAAFGTALAAIFLAFGPFVRSAQLSSIVLAGGAGALYLAQSSFWSVTTDIAGPFSGSVSGFMNMGAQIGGAVTAFLTPIIAARFDWTASFLAAAALSILGSLAWLLVNPNRDVGAFSL